jgi:hypothetical protein
LYLLGKVKNLRSNGHALITPPKGIVYRWVTNGTLEWWVLKADDALI